MMSLIITLIAIVVFIKLNKFYQFVILTISALLPFSFGWFGSIEDFMFIEWLVPVSMGIIIFDYAPPLLSIKKINYINFKGSGIFILAILILATWTIVSIYNHELFPSDSIYSKSIYQRNASTGSKRLYFNIFNNILLYFVVFIHIVLHFKEINFTKYFSILLYVALFFGSLRILSHFLGFDVPLLGGSFDYGGSYGKYATIKYGGTAFRLGGLAEIVTFGIPALFALSILKEKINIFALLALMFFLFISGGRTIMVGSIIAIIVFSFLFSPKYLIYFMVASILFIGLAFTLLPDSVTKGQFGRLTTFGGEEKVVQDDSRELLWKMYLDNFKSSPIWGKGIFNHEGYFYLGNIYTRAFALSQMFSGGHGSYISLMSTFGIGGIAYFLIMIVSGMIVAYRNIKINNSDDIVLSSISIFGFMILIIKSIDFITGGNGLTIPILFFIIGLISSVNTVKIQE